jgi:uncharacterized protein (DUF486 family)
VALLALIAITVWGVTFADAPLAVPTLEDTRALPACPSERFPMPLLALIAITAVWGVTFAEAPLAVPTREDTRVLPACPS